MKIGDRIWQLETNRVTGQAEAWQYVIAKVDGDWAIGYNRRPGQRPGWIERSREFTGKVDDQFIPKGTLRHETEVVENPNSLLVFQTRAGR